MRLEKWQGSDSVPHCGIWSFFGRLCESLQNFTFLPLIGCDVLASALNVLGLSLPISWMEGVELVQWFLVSLLLQPHNGGVILPETFNTGEASGVGSFQGTTGNRPVFPSVSRDAHSSIFYTIIHSQ